MGARPLRRAVQRFIEDPLSEEMLLGRFAEGDAILADVEEDGKIVFKKIEPEDGGKKKKKELVQS
jgi:ATP-dependent Clp protease ATP-binding subunit ClpC